MNNQYNIEFMYAKNGTKILKVNGFQYYSSYNPMNDIDVFLKKYIEQSCERYIMFGLGLGYHAKRLLELTEYIPLFIIETEKQLFETLIKEESVQILLKHNRVRLLQKFNEIELKENDCIIVLPAWEKALNNSTLKIAVQNFLLARNMQNSEGLLEYNFQQNIAKKYSDPIFFRNSLKGYTAVIVSAGPSLEDEINFLKRIKHKVFILCVGAAYSTLKKYNIKPDAVIIVDPNEIVLRQKIDSEYNGLIFIAATVYPEIVHEGQRNVFLLFQKGFSMSEQYAKKRNIDLLEVGGSVATWAISLLIYMNVQKIIFVGQDLAYVHGMSHASSSTSYQNYENDIQTNLHTLSNSGSQVRTTNSWNYFRTFIERIVRDNSSIEFINTSLNGALIKGVKYCDSDLIEVENINIDFVQYLMKKIVRETHNESIR